jgi:hypothetical protein
MKLPRLARKALSGGMSPMKLGFQIGKVVFFTEKLKYTIGQAEFQFLSRIGREVLRSSNRSMLGVGDKRLKKYWENGGVVPPSKPGKPPRARKGFFKTYNRYGYWAEQHAVVIGPMKLRGGWYDKQTKPGPGLQEKGGASYVPAWKTRAVFPKRPYMGPALDRTMRRVRSGRIRLRLRK